MSEENGVARMRELRTLEIAPGAKITFKPGDMHVMMIGLKQPLKEGQTFPLTLDFEKAGKVDVMVSVAKVGAMEHGI
jgi:periplasmic copper chaperone A